MKQLILPLALCGLSLVLIQLSVRRWADGGGVDWFSAIVAALTLGLAILTLAQSGSDE